MLKKFLFLPLILLLSICGCSEKKDVTPVLNNISFTAETQYESTSFSCDASVGDDALKLVVSKPEEIKDLCFEVSKNKAEVQFSGITYNPSIDSLPQGSIIKILYNVINDVKDGKTLNRNDKNCEIIGRAGGYKYLFIFSPSGLPISLYVDELNLKIEFKNVTIIK